MTAVIGSIEPGLTPVYLIYVCSLPALDFPCCRVLFGYCMLPAWTLACFGLPLCSTLWITFAYVLTHACVKNTLLSWLTLLACQCRSLPVVTTSLFNKASKWICMPTTLSLRNKYISQHIKISVFLQSMIIKI